MMWFHLVFCSGAELPLQINSDLSIEYVSPFTHQPLVKKGEYLESASGDERYPIINGQPSFLAEPPRHETTVSIAPVNKMSSRKRFVVNVLHRLGIGESTATKISRSFARAMIKADRYLKYPDYIFLSKSRPASYFSPMHSQRHSFMKKALKEIPLNATVIDVGAGTKPYKHLINARTPRYCTQDLFASAQDKIGIEQQAVDFVSSAEHMPIPSGSFDYAICTELLEHVTSPAGVMKEISRILKPGGKVIVTVPMIIGEHQQPLHFQNLTRYGLSQLSDESGLLLDTISSRGGYGSVMAALIRFMPGNLLRGQRFFVRVPLSLFVYLISPLTSILFPLLFIQFDLLDKEKRYTLGYHCVYSRPLNEVER